VIDNLDRVKIKNVNKSHETQFANFLVFNRNQKIEILTNKKITTMKDITRLNNAEYNIASKFLEDILVQGKLSHQEVASIVNIDNPLIVGDFLEKYQHFEQADIGYLKSFIIEQIDNENRLFVSDLIDFATDWEVELPYQKCIDLILPYEDDNTYVQLAVISYLFKNLKFNHIELLIKYLHQTLNNPECNQSVQINAALFLFRVTHKKQYLEDLIDLIVNGEDNIELMRNILELKYNESEYFDYHSLLFALLPH